MVGYTVASADDVIFAPPAQAVHRASIWASVEIVLVTLSSTGPERGGPW